MNEIKDLQDKVSKLEQQYASLKSSVNFPRDISFSMEQIWPTLFRSNIINVGNGAPDLRASKGSIYLRTDGSSSSTRLYVNSDGVNTWVAITTAS